MRLKNKIKNRARIELTTVELSMFVYITRRQGLDGLVENLNIKNVRNHIGYSTAGLYNALYSLEEKGFIEIGYTRMVNYDIIVKDNRFDCFADKSGKGSVDPYMNLDSKLFEDGVFHFQHIDVKRFLLNFMDFKHNFSISEDNLKEYKVFKHLDALHFLFDIYKKSNGVYVFSKKLSVFGKDHNVQYRYFYHKITRFIDKWKHLPLEEDIHKTVKVACRFVSRPWIVVEALKRLKKENKGLNYKYFNAIVSGTVKF